MGKADTRLSSQAVRLLKSGFFCYQLNGKYPVETLQSSIKFFYFKPLNQNFSPSMEDYKTLQTISGIVTHIQATKDTSGKKAFIGKIRSKELAHEENCLIDLKTCWSAGIDHFLDDSATIMVEAAWNESIRQYIAKNIMPCFSSDQNNFLIHGIKKTADKTRILLVSHADHLRGIVFSCFYDSLDMIVNEFSPCPDMPIMVTVKVISRNNSIKLDPVAFFSPNVNLLKFLAFLLKKSTNIIWISLTWKEES